MNKPMHSYVAMQDGKFRGATCPANEPGLVIDWEDDMADWWKDMIMSGCTIVTVFSPEKYFNLVKAHDNA